MFDKEKFKAMVHHIISYVDEPSRLGAVKLNKITWFVDGKTYMRTGSTMTGARYTKMPQGPVPKAMLPIIRELEDERKISVQMVPYYGLEKRQYTLLEEPSDTALSEDEKSLIEDFTDAITKNHTAATISELTHGSAWKLAEDDEEIPFHAVLADKLQKPTDSDLEWAIERMNAYSEAA